MGTTIRFCSLVLLWSTLVGALFLSSCIRDDIFTLQPIKLRTEAEWNTITLPNREEGAKLFLFDSITDNRITTFDGNHNSVLPYAPWNKEVIVGKGCYRIIMLNGGNNSDQYEGYSNIRYMGNTWRSFRIEATEPPNYIRANGEVIVNNPDTVVFCTTPLDPRGDTARYVNVPEDHQRELKYSNGTEVGQPQQRSFVIDTLRFNLQRLIYRVHITVSIVGYNAHKTPPARAAFKGFTIGTYIHNRMPINQYVTQRFNFDVPHEIVHQDSLVMHGSFSSFGPPLNDNGHRYDIDIYFNGSTSPHPISATQIDRMNQQVQRRIEQIHTALSLGLPPPLTIELELLITNPPTPGPEGGFSAEVDPWEEEVVLLPL